MPSLKRADIEERFRLALEPQEPEIKRDYRRAVRIREVALKAALTRGHLMTRFVPYTTADDNGKTYIDYGYSRCKRCGREIEYIVHPRQDQRDVVGSAITDNCEE